MADTYNASIPTLESSGPIGAIAISYGSGDQTLSGVPRGVYVAVTGHLKVDMANGTTATWSNLPVGQHSMAITKIYQTGSTASGLVLY
jgi:hypothetical protein